LYLKSMTKHKNIAIVALMKAKPVKQSQTVLFQPLNIILGIALFIGFLLLRSYFGLIATSVILAFLFNPLYQRLLKRTNNTGRAAAVTLLLAIISIVVPVLLILTLTVTEASNIITDISHGVTTESATLFLNNTLERISALLSDLMNKDIVISTTDVTEGLSGYASQAASFLLNSLKNTVGGLGNTVTSIILFMYIFTGLLVNQDKLVDFISRMNPLGDKNTQLYLKRAGAMTKAMVKGQFIIAVIQGLLSAIVLWLAGVPYFAFLLLILTFLSIIPLGTGILTIPLGIGFILFGHYVEGIFILLNHFLVVTNIDNYLKPKLVPKSVRLQPALLLLSVFGGISIFGFLGIVLGPVVMILVMTTIEIYFVTKKPLAKVSISKEDV
jgi:predicted PurR-regulated permease PerM